MIKYYTFYKEWNWSAVVTEVVCATIRLGYDYNCRVNAFNKWFGNYFEF